MSRSARRLRKQTAKANQIDVRFVDYDVRREALIPKKTFRLHDLVKIAPKTEKQRDAMIEWFDREKNSDEFYNDTVVLIGSAGTGKTFLACHMALQLVLNENEPYKKIVIVRSAVQSRNIGFLPGEEGDKISVFKAPYKYLFDKLVNYSKAYQNMEDLGIVQFECTSFLRGTTFEDAIVIFDECQDTTQEEFETVITRFGRNCRMFIVGDGAQNDIGTQSGFNKVMRVLTKMDGVSVVEFGIEDIVRSGFVKEYLRAKSKML